MRTTMVLIEECAYPLLKNDEEARQVHKKQHLHSCALTLLRVVIQSGKMLAMQGVAGVGKTVIGKFDIFMSLVCKV
jgi:ABC-type dipeptide/oligopeptide/nickel transport system ATPase subunit